MSVPTQRNIERDGWIYEPVGVNSRTGEMMYFKRSQFTAYDRNAPFPLDVLGWIEEE